MNKNLNDKNCGGDKISDFYKVKPNFELFDNSVYDPNRKMRSAWANKTHCYKDSNQIVREERPFKIEFDGVFENTVISAFFDENTTEIEDDIATITPPQTTNIKNKLIQFKNGEDDKKLEKLVFFANNGFDTIKSHLDLMKVGYALAMEFDMKGKPLFLHFAEKHTSKLWSEVEKEYNDKYSYFITSNNTKTNTVSLATIYWLFKQINPDLFKKLNKEWNTEHTDINLISGIHITGIVADYFKQLYGDIFITVDNMVYMFDGFRWIKSDEKHTELTNFVDKVFYKDLIDYGDTKMKTLLNKLTTATKDEAERINEEIKEVGKYLSSCNYYIRNSQKRKSYIDDIINFTTNNKQEFDRNPYLFAFNNKIWDLENACWVEPDPSQYINKTAGYDYVNIDPTLKTKAMEELQKVINNIFPNPEIRDYYLTYLATGLSGIQMETFMIATGVGGNGKGVINGLMMTTVGEYGYCVPCSSLVQEIKLGPNPELCNLNNIRFGLTTEPGIKKKFCCSTIKTITGDAILPVRGLYSDKVAINLNVSLVCEANEVPPFDEVNQAVNRRVRATVFESIAIDKCDYDKLDADEKPKYCIKNEHYKSLAFKNENKQLFFDILQEYFIKFKNNKYALPEMPTQCKRKVLNLLATSDGLFSWFEDMYEKETDLTKCEPIPLSEIYKKFNTSPYFMQLSKADQRSNNRKSFLEKMEINIFLQKYIRKRDRYFNNIKLTSDCIVGWKLKPNEDEYNNEAVAECK